MSESSSILEELWQTKEKIASKYATLREYFEALVQRQNEAHPEFAKA